MNDSKLKYFDSTPLPHNFLAEQGVLNILLTNPALIENVFLSLKIDAFYYVPHKLIYQTIVELYESQQNINVPTVITRLQDQNLLKEVGGLERIIDIINRFENFSDLNQYIKLLNEKYLRRLIIETGKQTILLGYTTTLNLNEILAQIEQSVFKLNQKTDSQKIYSSAEIIDDVFNEMLLKVKKDETLGLKTHYKDLDSILQGIQKSDLIVIAGRPSMGKTAFSLNLARNILTTNKIPVFIFSLEMSKTQIMYRFLDEQSKINSNKLKSNKMSEREWHILSDAMRKISEWPLYIDDNSNLTVFDIRTKLRKILTENNQLGVVIIDYLQLMKSNTQVDNRVQEISKITRNLKMLAKEFNIPIIVLSQLSRNVESRINKRPMLSDLRESGCVLLTKNRSLKFSLNSRSIFQDFENNFKIKGIKPTYQLIFENDNKLHLTGNHKILSDKGWIRISELKKNTKIGRLTNEKKLTFLKFCKLQEIRCIGLQLVYDKTVPKIHNYLSNNFILHNSIEQDADIVVMLYRDDYYDANINESGVTEFIVAKHRNGPTGTAKLTFNSTITRFENIE